MKKRFLQLSLLLALGAAPARADDCNDALDESQRGQNQLVAATDGAAMAKKLCDQLARSNVASTDCKQLSDISANPNLRNGDVQEALGRFEKTYGISKEDFLDALAKGTLPDLLADRGVKFPAGVLEAALQPKNGAAPSGGAAGAVASSISKDDGAVDFGAGRKPASGAGRLRDALRAKLDKSAEKARVPKAAAPKVAENQLKDLTPYRELFAANEAKPEEKSLTLFEVVHLRYEKLTDRMAPGKTIR